MPDLLRVVGRILQDRADEIARQDGFAAAGRRSPKWRHRLKPSRRRRPTPRSQPVLSNPLAACRERSPRRFGRACRSMNVVIRDFRAPPRGARRGEIPGPRLNSHCCVSCRTIAKLVLLHSASYGFTVSKLKRRFEGAASTSRRSPQYAGVGRRDQVEAGLREAVTSSPPSAPPDVQHLVAEDADERVLDLRRTARDLLEADDLAATQAVMQRGRDKGGRRRPLGQQERVVPAALDLVLGRAGGSLDREGAGAGNRRGQELRQHRLGGAGLADQEKSPVAHQRHDGPIDEGVIAVELAANRRRCGLLLAGRLLAFVADEEGADGPGSLVSSSGGRGASPIGERAFQLVGEAWTSAELPLQTSADAGATGNPR